jgi:DNA-binding NarL/FixJ family response regulator
MGLLVLTPDHRIGFTNAAAEAWLDLIYDSEREGHLPLPTAVWSAVAGLGSTAHRRALSAVVVQSAVGPLKVEASPGSEDGSIAVVVSPIRRLMPPEIPREWPVSSREREVIALLIRGQSNRQIADALCIGEKTVETHLGHIYEKVEVRTRSQLLARYFRERYLPALERP